jgi:hypothetical protein
VETAGAEVLTVAVVGDAEVVTEGAVASTTGAGAGSLDGRGAAGAATGVSTAASVCGAGREAGRDGRKPSGST